MKEGNASPDSQDLYARWLSIPPGPRPPDHYTLLGLPLFCADIPLIEGAAHRQLDLLDIHALHLDPEKRAACQRLMNEVAQARSVLTDPKRRVDYDCTLLIQHGVAGAPLPSSRDSRQTAPVAPLVPAPEAGLPAPTRARLSKPLSVALLAGAMIAVGSLMVWAWVLHSREQPMETAVALPAPAKTAPAPAPVVAPPPSVATEPAVSVTPPAAVTPAPAPAPAAVMAPSPSVATQQAKPMTPPPTQTPPAVTPVPVPAPAVVVASPPSAPGAQEQELSFDLGGATMRLVYIPPGTFFMGSPDYDENHFPDETPQHPVTLTAGFYMAVTEVTQEQHQAVMGLNPSEFRGPKNPVEMVSWDDATEFCRKVSEKTGRKVRLPTEAEWEYACRAGSETAFSFGADDRALGGYAWYDGNSGGQTHPVGQKKPNAWGLYDMHGNVWEWCADWSSRYPNSPAVDPTGPGSGMLRVWRGGCYNNILRVLRSAYRASQSPGSKYNDTGFRVVVDSATTVLVQAPPPPAPAKTAPVPAPASAVQTTPTSPPKSPSAPVPLPKPAKASPKAPPAGSASNFAKLAPSTQIDLLKERLAAENSQSEVTIEYYKAPDGILRELYLSHNKNLASIRALKGLKLTRLSLSMCPALTSLDGLEGMPLTDLSLGSCRLLTSLEPLRGMPLEKLVLAGCSGLAGDLSALKGMKLKQLDLSNCLSLSSLRGIEGMPLTQLSLFECRAITDLEPLRGMPLTRLTLFGCRSLTNLEPLTGMPLQYLHLHECTSLTNLEPLRGMPLVELNLRGLKSSSPEVVAELKKSIPTLQKVDP